MSVSVVVAICSLVAYDEDGEELKTWLEMREAWERVLAVERSSESDRRNSGGEALKTNLRYDRARGFVMF